MTPPAARNGRHRSGAGPAAGIARRAFLSDHFILSLTLLYFLILCAAVPGMANLYTVGNISTALWPLLTLVLGQMFVLLVAGIDLSQTAIMAVTSVLGGMVMTGGLNPELFDKSPLWGIVLSAEGGPLGGSALAVPAGIAVMCLAGAVIGLLNGLSVAKLRMPPFMVTLVSMIFFGGMAIFLTRSRNIPNLPGEFGALGQEGFGTVPTSWMLPYSLLFAVPLAAAAYFVLTRTVLGTWFYAVGTNVKAAVISGVPAERVTILAYVFSGFCAGVGSVLYSSRLEGGRPTLGQNQLLDIIGAAVIGGISLFGGKGSVRCAIYGVLFFTVLATSLNMLNLDFYMVHIVKGGVIVLAAAVDVARTRLRGRGT